MMKGLISWAGAAFAKREALLRQAARRAAEGRWAFPGQERDAFSPPECRNYSRHRG
jgi:hypothetical protein